MNLEFEHPWAIILLVLPVLVYRWAPPYETKRSAIRVSFFDVLTDSLGLRATKGATKLTATRWQQCSLILGWILLVAAMAKPVWLSEPQTREVHGRDLMIVMDLSGSMAQEDFVNASGDAISRLTAAKGILSDFSHDRQGDRLGLILFGDAAYLQTPFTADLDAWNALLNETRVAMAGQNTHLGDAIGLGIKNFLENSVSEEKVMLVLTDGNDTDSLVPPIEAAKVAAQYDIRIHMIAMGDPATVGEQELDMEVIEQVSLITGGQAFLALSPSELQRVYEEIALLEPVLFESSTYQIKESKHYVPVLILTLNYLVLMWVYTLKRRISFRISPVLKKEHNDE
ncbi:VWA domain-containing protein [Vibrio splendidus]|uniref:VWA domain-containing protein n=1 Tax=Vibrio splendidus TaxID=29497 RepID=UPI00246916D2|nr:VWA domain-containing protein [Vibrio splendidus]MDH5911483.1 VWA domain-containing protein [Vibrio splendidus]MDH5942732.1 VWA domain-containing protein [Vibrio splendidus]MDH5985721.1 VWA domain-containing protein [Vibrio splendidus]MDH5994309.1 VWA domain-containing protein [Vibrio splendidus]MDH6005148.1 VWA domain-containing protein [Vibrio splendidus]